MKFQCLDKDGALVGNILAANAEAALEAAQKLNDNIARVVPMEGSEEVPKAPKKGKKAKPVVDVKAN